MQLKEQSFNIQIPIGQQLIRLPKLAHHVASSSHALYLLLELLSVNRSALHLLAAPVIARRDQKLQERMDTLTSYQNIFGLPSHASYTLSFSLSCALAISHCCTNKGSTAHMMAALHGHQGWQDER